MSSANKFWIPQNLLNSISGFIFLLSFVVISWLDLPMAYAEDGLDHGLVKVESIHSVADTGDRLEDLLRTKGIMVFTRIDHGAGATSVELNLRPTEVIIFGNPKVGTPLMQCNQAIGIDLPLKALIWQDAEGKVWLAYNDPEYLAIRHELGSNCAANIQKLGEVLLNLAETATGT
jgi:uncharacterized protein (DUF302 family)